MNKNSKPNLEFFRFSCHGNHNPDTLKSLKHNAPPKFAHSGAMTPAHAALYVLEKGATVHWRKTGIEGFFYILKRDSVPRYRLLLRNQADNTEGDFIQSIDDNIKFEVKEDTFFYQIGDHGDVRGLWFHDKDFMSKFVKTISTIYSELGLVCDGTFDNNQLPAPGTSNPASGHAILQMLKKGESTPIREAREARSAPPSAPAPVSNIMDLLRREFTSPPPPPPPVDLPPVPVAAPQATMMPPVPLYPVPVAQTIAPFADRREPIGDTITVSRSDLRMILGDMVCSDRFIDEMFHRLAARARH